MVSYISEDRIRARFFPALGIVTLPIFHRSGVRVYDMVVDGHIYGDFKSFFKEISLYMFKKPRV